MDFHSYGIVVIALICLHLNRITVAGPDACMEKLSMEDKKTVMAVMDTCKKKLNLDETMKPEDLEKNGFEDKCFAKCKLTEMKLLNADGTLNNKTVEEMLKKAVTDKQADLLNLFQTCHESTKKAMDAEGGINEKTSCKAAAMLAHCIMQGVQKFC